jgi:signal transduction histidine kinase
MQAAMARRSDVGELRREVAETSLAVRSFLLTGRSLYLEPLRTTTRDLNETADSVMRGYASEPAAIGETARQLRYLAGVQNGTTLALLALYSSRGAVAARELALAQAPLVDPLDQFLAVADRLEHYEDARVRDTRAHWQREQRLARRLALTGIVVNMVLVLSASLMVLAMLRRHREGLAQVARHKDALEIEAAARAAELNEVYAHLQTVQEQERSRLARGLHDELGGLLLAARMDVSWVRQHARDAEPHAVAARIDRILDALDQGIDLKRRVIEELRPTLLDNMGLLAAIRWQLDETCARARLQCACHFPAGEPQIAPDTAIALFRVVQEAITNVLKHASARRVDVTLDVVDERVLLAVVDDGVGIDAAGNTRPHAHGLNGMKHRISAIGGTLTVSRSPGGGTEVRAIAPCSAANDFLAPPAETSETSRTGVAGRR